MTRIASEIIARWFWLPSLRTVMLPPVLCRATRSGGLAEGFFAFSLSDGLRWPLVSWAGENRRVFIGTLVSPAGTESRRPAK